MSVSTQRVSGILKRASFPRVQREQDAYGMAHITGSGFTAWKTGDETERFIAVQPVFVWSEMIEWQEWEYNRELRRALSDSQRALEAAGMTCSVNERHVRVELES